MIGSEVVNTLLAQELPTLPAVASAVGNRLASIEIVPQGMSLPAGLFHTTSSSYGGTVGGEPLDESLGYTVRFICAGTSTDPVWDAALAQKSHLSGKTFRLAVQGDNYAVTFTATGEAIPTTVYEGGTYYRILGTTYDVHVTKG